MARQWFTAVPDHYFMKMNRRGHRNEVFFTFVGLGLFHLFVTLPMRRDYQETYAHTNQGPWSHVGTSSMDL
eukprot:CAMPEP_0114589702 /NCGR_PEP_ID=MMETSP0125-20121206/12098_1 /TAXON_ID=485358 ORGANISM="Aristerostoma sp., Strain ATCC 50986" /NCGR_SAMPLE_ID=MMETSP0125 /ASSEMBLY_ACC=CAM_ASM_000245 /LENGTH=70 /DNA_ID=CAMNT_0001786749 /DNA_START=43 /DNA_END=255 /DNA_ORIENTATION=+